MTVKRVKLSGWECVCERCGHRWTTLGPEPPRACAGCKRINWDRKAKATPLRRHSRRP